MKANVLGMRGYLLAQRILEGQISPALAAYSVWEGQVRLTMRLRDTRRHPDALQFMRARLERAARPSAAHMRLPGYIEFRKAVDRLATRTAERSVDSDFDAYWTSWFKLGEARQVLNSIQRLKVATRTWRWLEPKRLTQRLVNQLVQEYRDVAAIFELQLPRMLGIASAIDGTYVPWARLYKPTLMQKLGSAQGNISHPELGVLALAIQREVRNALAHGGPVFNAQASRIELQSRGRTVVSWSAEQFFNETKRLLACVLALYQFDDEVIFRSYERRLAQLSDAIRAQDAAVLESDSNAAVAQ
jgi:hypothetical protein